METAPSQELQAPALDQFLAEEEEGEPPEPLLLALALVGGGQVKRLQPQPQVERGAPACPSPSLPREEEAGRGLGQDPGSPSVTKGILGPRPG